MKKIALIFSLFALVVLAANPVQAQTSTDDENMEDLLTVPDLEEEDADAVLLASANDKPEKKNKKDKKKKAKKVKDKTKMKSKDKKKNKMKKEDDMES